MSIKHRISKAVGFRPRRGRGGYALRLIAAVALAAGAFSATPANAQVDANALAPAVHTVACGGGVSVRMVTPNAGFDPQTASDAQLDANALPPRPTNAAALAVWKRFIAMPDDPTPRCPVNSATSPARSAPLAPISTRPSKAVSAASEVNSTHWSGNIADDQSYTDAFGTWDVPFSGPRPASDPAYSSSWVGVGQGDSAEQPLMQAGTESDNTGEASYYLWWELYPENDQKFIGYVEPGDSIYVHAHLSYGDDYAIAEDLTSGLGKGQNFYLSETSIWPDNTAEWIFERTELVGSTSIYPMLADAPPTFTGATALGTGYGGTVLGDLPHYYSDMFTCNGDTEMASPGSINSAGGFTLHWLSYGTQEPAC